VNIEYLFNQFLEKKKIDLKTENTCKAYAVTFNAIKNIADQYIMSEDEFYTLIFDYLKLMYENGQAEKTTTARRSHIKQLVKYAAKTKIIKNDFSDEIESIKLTRKEPNSITIEGIIAIYNRLDEDVEQAYEIYYEGKSSSYKLYCSIRNKILFETLLTLGERVSNTVSLKWEDIDYKERIIKVNNKKSKIFSLKPVTQEYIGVIMNFRTELERLYKMNSKADYLRRSEYIFFSLKDPTLPMSTRQVERIISSLAKRAGIHENKTPHSIRHTYASLMVAIDLTSATELLGHKDRTTTANIYAHTLGLDRKRDVVNQGMGIVLEAIKKAKSKKL